MFDEFNLQRFVDAQAPIYPQVRSELEEGRKRSHWIWFIFPQIKGLGSSTTAVAFGIASKAEAVAYLRHPILGDRLRECTRLALDIEDRSAGRIFGAIDEIKFRSSMTLFASADPEEELFHAALRKYFGGRRDQETLKRL